MREQIEKLVKSKGAGTEEKLRFFKNRNQNLNQHKKAPTGIRIHAQFQIAKDSVSLKKKKKRFYFHNVREWSHWNIFSMISKLGQ